MSNIDKRALRHSAESIIGILENIAGFEPSDIDGDSVELRFETEDGFDTGCDVSIVDQCQKTADVVRALLDELERNQQYIKRRDQENEDIALTVGKLRVELEGKDSKIANLTAERDALREGEMGDARHSNTRAAADIYFQLVEECEIPAGGSLVEYVDDMREKLEAAEKRIAELSASHRKLRNTMAGIHNTIRMDGGYTPLAAILNAAKRAYEESASAAGIRIKGE
ncbi:TPA: ead/Ea22-like family protein [Escherichia coli]|nr:ead/Ea22-like family protein [Escherichia coli]